MFARSYPMASQSADRDWDSVQFRFIFALSFVFHLAAAAGAKLLPVRRSSTANRRSIISESLARAGTTAQIAFYG